MTQSITIPIKTVSEANAHEHWRARQKRAKDQRGISAMVCRSKMSLRPIPCTVRITRIAPRSLDSDNLAGSQKHIRDGIADFLGINDNDKRVQWEYAQERGKPKEYSVRIEIVEANQ